MDPVAGKGRKLHQGGPVAGTGIRRVRTDRFCYGRGHLLPDEIEILVVGTLVLMDNMIAVMRWLQERGFS
jgi:hypothetical protein